MKVDTDLIAKITALPKPKIIAISGFGGSGKTTFARMLGEELHAPVVGIDSFQREHSNLSLRLWTTMDFDRLKEEVVDPFLRGEHTIKYGVSSHKTETVERYLSLNTAGILIIEGVGLFRPNLIDDFAFKIWIDCPLEEADMRGRERDEKEHGNLHDNAYYEFWKQNDREYFDEYRPKEVADVIVVNK